MGQVLDYRLTMPVRPVELAQISVEGERQCNIRKAEGERVAAVWEEARKALTTAVWTEKERNFRFTIQLWERLLDPRNLEIPPASPYGGQAGKGGGRIPGKEDTCSRRHFPRNRQVLSRLPIRVISQNPVARLQHRRNEVACVGPFTLESHEELSGIQIS